MVIDVYCVLPNKSFGISDVMNFLVCSIFSMISMEMDMKLEWILMDL